MPWGMKPSVEKRRPTKELIISYRPGVMPQCALWVATVPINARLEIIDRETLQANAVSISEASGRLPAR
jgi:hypothetical protein